MNFEKLRLIAREVRQISKFNSIPYVSFAQGCSLVLLMRNRKLNSYCIFPKISLPGPRHYVRRGPKQSGWSRTAEGDVNGGWHGNRWLYPAIFARSESQKDVRRGINFKIQTPITRLLRLSITFYLVLVERNLGLTSFVLSHSP